jgi:chromosome segregation ATPase
MPTYFCGFSWFSAIPDIVWSGVIASLMTLFGVLVADFRNTARQTRQHKFDAVQKQKDRTMALRRELYVPIAGLLAAAKNELLTLGDVEFEGREIIIEKFIDTPISLLDTAASEVAMIAEPGTAILAQRLITAFNAAKSVLSDASRELQKTRMTLNANELARADLEKHFDRATERLEDYVAAGSKDAATRTSLEERQEHFLQNLEKLEGQIPAMHDAVQRELVAYSHVLAGQVKPLQGLAGDFLIAMRGELTGESDHTALISTFKQMVDQDHLDLAQTIKKATQTLTPKN